MGIVCAAPGEDFAMISRRSIILAIASMPLLARAVYSQTAVKARYVGLLVPGTEAATSSRGSLCSTGNSGLRTVARYFSGLRGHRFVLKGGRHDVSALDHWRRSRVPTSRKSPKRKDDSERGRAA